MDKVTQQNAAMVEETTAAAQSLEAETDGLARMTAKFRTCAKTAPGNAPDHRPRPQMRMTGRGGAAVDTLPTKES